MELVVTSHPVVFRLRGCSLIHAAGADYGPEILALLDRIWGELRGPVRRSAQNHAVYEADDIVFAGVDGLGGRMPQWHRRDIVMDRYVVWRHVGPYSGLGETYTQLMRRIEDMGLSPVRPWVERYGHQRDPEKQPETDIYVPVA